MSLDLKQKNALLGVGVALCLMMSADKLIKFYQERQPPFKAGECFVITDPRVGEIKFQVVENDKLKAESTLVGEVDMGFAKLTVPAKASFEEIRDLNPVKVDCK